MTEHHLRFRDENLRLSDFYREVWVLCPSCSKKALATVNFESQKARLFCMECSYLKESTTAIFPKGNLIMSADRYFQAELWLKMSFRNEVFWAYNGNHLNYLKNYISATLREHKDRSHFTLLEKLPKFYHDAKNRQALLKIIAKLEVKI